MIGVLQTRRDNCVAACVATVFRLPIEEVPDFDPTRWDSELNAWVQRFGMAIQHVTFRSAEDARTVQGVTLGEVECQSADFPPEYRHCVVCEDGEVVWCPKRGALDGSEVSLVHTFFYLVKPWEALRRPVAE